MKYTIENRVSLDEFEKVDYDSILRAMEFSGVFSVERKENGLFLIREEGEGHYAVRLTPEQLFALGNELIKMSGSVRMDQ